MSMLTLTSREAETRFGKIQTLLDVAQREPVTINNSGVMFVVIKRDDLDELVKEQAERAEIVAEYDAYMEKVRQEASPAVQELTDEFVNQLVHELR